MDQTKAIVGKASVGRIVNVVLDAGIPDIRPHAVGQIRPAIVVRTWGEGGGPSESVNLQVFLDGSNDLDHLAPGIGAQIWLTSAHYSAEPKPRTWHWPPRS